MKLGECFSFSNGKSVVGLAPGIYKVYGSTGIIGTSDKWLFNGPNTLIARVGANCGFSQFVDGEYWVSDNTIIAHANDTVLPKYGYYLIGRIDLQRLKIGAAQPLLTIGILNSIEASIHSLEEQHHIVNTISFLLLKSILLFLLVLFPPSLIQITQQMFF